MKKLALAATLSAALLTGCASTPSAAPTATVTATVTTAASPRATSTPTPAPVKTSGSYAADLAAAGTKPEDPGFFGDHMTKELCRSTMDPTAVTNRFSDNVKRHGIPGSERSGSSPAVVRLTIAYFCPERADAAEQQMKTLGYTK